MRLTSSRKSSLACLALAVGGVSAQQYVGAPVNNSLPSTSGAVVTYFNVKDAKGQDTTLLNYFSAPNGKRQDESKVQRAIIIIHGLNRDPWDYFGYIWNLIPNAAKHISEISEETVSIMSPYFPNGADKNFGYPWTDGLAAGRGSTSKALVWSDSDWASGANNIYPYNQNTVSSYEALDQILQYYNNATLYPNLKEVVIGGHSLGGQIVQRYAMVGNDLNLRFPVTYWMGNPDSFGWLNSSRPIAPGSCTIYNDWREGLSKYTNTYGADLVAKGSQAVTELYQSRALVYARGLNDFGNEASNCAPSSQGSNRAVRFYNFITYFTPNTNDYVDYVPKVGHSAPEMFAASSGIARFFLDNWYGNGKRAPDFGPRQEPGDDPNPDPNYASKWGNSSSSGDQFGPQPVTSGLGMRYDGCYTDSGDTRTLSYTAGTFSNLTVKMCVNMCLSKGYSVAGMEYSTECYCGNALDNAPEKVTDQTCGMACGGSSKEACGGSFLLSVYNQGTLTSFSPKTVKSVGDYKFIGCWTDSVSNRSLAVTQAGGANNTIQSCAESCQGYTYFGTEYASECYCGNVIGGNKTVIGSCDMSCSGNQTQYCGGSNRLNVYELKGSKKSGSTSLDSDSKTTSKSQSSSSFQPTSSSKPVSSSKPTSTSEQIPTSKVFSSLGPKTTSRSKPTSSSESSSSSESTSSLEPTSSPKIASSSKPTSSSEPSLTPDLPLNPTVPLDSEPTPSSGSSSQMKCRSREGNVEARGC